MNVDANANVALSNSSQRCVGADGAHRVYEHACVQVVCGCVRARESRSCEAKHLAP